MSKIHPDVTTALEGVIRDGMLMTAGGLAPNTIDFPGVHLCRMVTGAQEEGIEQRAVRARAVRARTNHA